jgi:Replication-relaxation
VSGRRRHPAAPPPGEQLTALVGRLTAGDWQLCRLLADHQVLTAGLLALLLGTSPRTLQQRLTTLTTLKVVDRFRPHRPLGAGSAPYHYLLGEAGAAVLATDPTIDRSSWDRAQLLRLADANGRLPHLLGVNTVLAQLTHTARHRPGTRLVCWWPAHRCQTQWGRLIAPDAYVRWQDPDGEVDFFLHHATQPAADQPALLVEGYNDLAAATGITTPVLLDAADPDQEAQLRDRLTGQRLLVPVATSNPAYGPPTEAAWLPTSSPAGGRRYRLGALGHPDPWHPADRHGAPRGGGLCRAAVARLKAPPGGGRTPPPPPDPSVDPPNQDQQKEPDVGKRPIQPNQETILELPSSEVCMHLGVAGTRMRARLEPNGMVQLLDPDGRDFSFPITAAEAGLHHDQDGWSTPVTDPPDPLADRSADQDHRAVLEAVSEPLAIDDRNRWRGAVIDGPAGPLYWHPTLGYLSVPDPDSDR